MAEKFSCRPSDFMYPYSSDILRFAVDNYCFSLMNEYEHQQLEEIKRETRSK